MSLKAVELQVAIPRTNDASMQQSQRMQKPILDQTALAQLSSRQAEVKRKKTMQAEREHSLENEENNRDHRHSLQQEISEQDEVITHPYKGKKVDVTL